MRPHEGRQSFCPPAGLRNPHVQSILATLGLRARWSDRNDQGGDSPSRNVIVHCEDDTRVMVAHSPPRNSSASRGAAILFHGWEGSADSSYIVCLGRHLHRLGYEVFRVNFPDHGGTQELNPGIFHSCRLEEMVLAVEQLVRLSTSGPTFLVGFSLGGNFALRIALEAPSRGIPIEHVVAICPVIDPSNCLAAIERAPWFYQQRFLSRWTRSLRLKERAFPDRYPLDPLGPANLRKRTDLLIKRFTDFAGIDEYHDGFSIARDRLAGLSCPATILASEDDPVVPVDDLLEIEKPDCLEIEIQRWGGHCGFIDNPGRHSWVERRVAQILARTRTD